MAEIIQESNFELIEWHAIVLTNEKGFIYDFDCDGEGNLLDPKHEERVASLIANGYKKSEVRDRSREVKHAAIIRCSCGAEVHLWDSWANTCEGCGTEYNGSAQELAPRSQWGEETGEVFL